MPNREPIETTNLDTINGCETIPWSRPRDLLAVAAFTTADPHGATRWRF